MASYVLIFHNDITDLIYKYLHTITLFYLYLQWSAVSRSKWTAISQDITKWTVPVSHPTSNPTDTATSSTIL